MTIRLLMAAESETGSVPPWRALVSACGGWEPYVRSYGGTIGQRSRRPSSCCWTGSSRARCCGRSTMAETCLAELEGIGVDAQYADPRRDPSSARRIVGRTRTSLDYRTGGELAEERAHMLSSLQRTVASAHTAVTRSFFRREDAVTWANIGAAGAPAGRTVSRDARAAAEIWRLLIVHRTVLTLPGHGDHLVQRGAHAARPTSPARRCCPRGWRSTRSRAC